LLQKELRHYSNTIKLGNNVQVQDFNDEFEKQCWKEFDEKLREKEQTYLESQLKNIARLEKDKAEKLFEYEEMVIKV
jgi:hypothetical protein